MYYLNEHNSPNTTSLSLDTYVQTTVFVVHLIFNNSSVPTGSSFVSLVPRLSFVGELVSFPDSLVGSGNETKPWPRVVSFPDFHASARSVYIISNQIGLSEREKLETRREARREALGMAPCCQCNRTGSCRGCACVKAGRH